jgi:hypothetical protein
MAERFNPRACWLALDADQQRTIGEAALLLAVSTEAQAINCENGTPSPEVLRVDRRWEHAEQVAWNLLADTIPVDADLFPDGPDLAAIDVRACRECGCTDEEGCAGGCTWSEPDLCSACAPEGCPNG